MPTSASLPLPLISGLIPIRGRRIALLAVAGLAASGCLNVAPQPAPPPTSMSSWGPLGGFQITSGATCAGHVILSGGRASVTDACFTGADNVVLCTDATAANPVMCAASAGTLIVTGVGADDISYARVR